MGPQVQPCDEDHAGGLGFPALYSFKYTTVFTHRKHVWSDQEPHEGLLFQEQRGYSLPHNEGNVWTKLKKYPGILQKNTPKHALLLVQAELGTVQREDQ